MSPEDIGKVFSALMRFRIVSSGAYPSSRKHDLERQAANILDNAHGRVDDLIDFLETQGLRLDVRELSDYGLGIGSCYILMRAPRAELPEHITSEHLLKELAAGRIGSDTVERSTAWACFMFLSMMWFLYTRNDRGIEQVSGFDDAVIGIQDFTEEVELRVEELRSSANGHADDEQSGHFRTREGKAVWENLIASKGKIETRTNSFIVGMVKLGFLEPIQDMDGYYRQTFVSALDIAENFSAYAGGLIHPILAQAQENDVAKLVYETVTASENQTSATDNSSRNSGAHGG